VWDIDVSLLESDLTNEQIRKALFRRKPEMEEGKKLAEGQEYPTLIDEPVSVTVRITVHQKWADGMAQSLFYTSPNRIAAIQMWIANRVGITLKAAGVGVEDVEWIK
jgi:hypothetical protein